MNAHFFFLNLINKHMNKPSKIANRKRQAADLNKENEARNGGNTRIANRKQEEK